MKILLACMDAPGHFNTFYALAKALITCNVQVYISTGAARKNIVNEIGAIYVKDIYYYYDGMDRHNRIENAEKSLFTKKYFHNQMEMLNEIKPDLVIIDNALIYFKPICELLRYPHKCLYITPFIYQQLLTSDPNDVINNYINNLPCNVKDDSQKIESYALKLLMAYISYKKEEIVNWSSSYFSLDNLLFSTKEIEPFSWFPETNENLKLSYSGLYNMQISGRETNRHKEKIILISMGNDAYDYSNGFLLKLHKMFISVLNDTKFKVYMSFNSNPISELGPIPDNIHVDKNINQQKILAKASLFISHLGFCSYREAIYYNVPLIGIPIVNDNFIVALSVIKNKIGIVLDKDTISPIEISKAINSVIDDKTFLSNISELSEESRAIGGEKHMAEQIVNKAR